MIRASIDIGTNSVLLLVIEDRGGEIFPVRQEIREPRLGRGLWESGRISADSITSTKKALRELAVVARDCAAERIIAFGTEVFRGSNNGVDVARELGENCGLDIRILTAEEEARFAFKGAVSGLDIRGSKAVVDVGGGSAEIAIGDSEPKSWRSLQIGAVVLTDRLAITTPFNRETATALFSAIAAEIGFLDITSEARIIGVGGTITTLAAIKLGLTRYDPDLVHGTEISLQWLETIFEEFQQSTLDEIAQRVLFSPARVDILTAGTAVFIQVLRHANLYTITISDRGAHWGIMLS